MQGVVAQRDARLAKLGFVLVVSLISLACATTTWVPKPDDPKSDEIAASLAGKRTILLLTPPARTDEPTAQTQGERTSKVSSTRSARSRTVELEMDIEKADGFANRSETASGTLRSVAVSDVRSMSFVNDRVSTAFLGALVGASVLGVTGYVSFSHASASENLGGVGASLGALTGLVSGALVGALIGHRVYISIEPGSGVAPPPHH